MKNSEIYYTAEEVKRQGKIFIAEQAEILRKELRTQKSVRETQYV